MPSFLQWIRATGLVLALVAGFMIPSTGDANAVSPASHEPGPGSVSGRVSVPEGYDPTQVRVWIQKQVGWNLVAETTVASDGSYTVGGIPEGAYVAFFFGPGLVEYFYDNGGYGDKAKPIKVGPGAAVAGIDAVMTKVSSISGRITAPEGHSARGAVVYAWPLDPYAVETSLRTGPANVDGTFTIEGLRYGKYRLEVQDHEYWDVDTHVTVEPTLVGEWYSDQLLMTNAEVVDLKEDEHLTGYDIELRPLVEFSDVASGSQFAAEMTWLGSTGVSTGYPDGTYRPLQRVNRDAMAAFLYRLSGRPAFDPPSRSPFSDVATNNQFYKEITWLASTGITTGWPDGTFRPTEPVSREAMAAFLYRFAGQPATDNLTWFQDVPSRSLFYKEISWLASTGITTGWRVGTSQYYRPADPIARDAMAAFMSRYATHVNKKKWPW